MPLEVRADGWANEQIGNDAVVVSVNLETQNLLLQNPLQILQNAQVIFFYHALANCLTH
jgi:hypothetical protein